MNSKSKGNLGEIKVASEFIKYGCMVSFPFGDNARYDLVVDMNGELKKVQVKYAASKNANGAWRCMCVSSTNHTTNKKLDKYKNDVDIMAYYIPELDICIMFNIEEIGDKTSIHVRNEAPLNSQNNVIYIKDHTFDKYFK